jgi:hypothetical protein
VAPLAILVPPANASANVGATVTLSLVASGTGDLRYQWRKDGFSIPNATNASYIIALLQPEHEGFYDAMVSDISGSIISPSAAVSVRAGSLIVQSPISQSVVRGGSITLSVRTSGTLPMQYRWRRNGLSVLTNIVSSRTDFYSATDIITNAYYDVVVTNGIGSGALSTRAEIEVLDDTDGDGLPDEWETAHGLDPNSNADRDSDPDGDTMTNWEEFIAGTDPQNPENYLKVSENAALSGGGAILRFNAVSNRTYTIESRANVAASPWTRVADTVASSTSREISITNSQPGSASRFYRLMTPKLP